MNAQVKLRLRDKINADTFAKESTEPRDRIADVTLRIEAIKRGRSNMVNWR